MCIRDRFNIYNVLALTGVLIAMGCDDKMVIDAVENVKPIEGRMEPVSYTHLVNMEKHVIHYN